MSNNNRKRQPFTFPTDSDTNRNRNSVRKTETDQQKKYEIYSKIYLNQQYTYESHHYIKNITESAKHYISKGIPVYQILIAVSKKLLMNQLELLFLNCLIEELKWQIMDQTVKNHALTLKPLVKGSKEESQQYKCLELYILLSAYAVKVYLNDDIKIFQNQMNDLIPKFPQIFQLWGNKFAKNALSTNPKKLNKKYVEYTSKMEEKQLKHQDLNQKVNELLENTPNPQSKPQYTTTGITHPSSNVEIQHHQDQQVQVSGGKDNDDELKQIPLPSLPSRLQNSFSELFSGYIRQPSDLMSILQPPAFYRLNSTDSDYGLKPFPSIKQ